jgi:pyruvate dehydrogenase E1 component alpha subunit
VIVPKLTFIHPHMMRLLSRLQGLSHQVPSLALAPKQSMVTNSVAAMASTASEVQFQTNAYKLHKLDKGPATDVSLSREDSLSLYTNMQTIRRMETTASALYKSKSIRGFCHLYSGQEAIAVGMKAALSDVDTVITAYRCHGWVYMMGATVPEVLCELTGRVSGNVHGKGGSMHMYKDNFFGGNGIVGAQVPLGVGIALAHQYKGDNGVNLSLYGDGAANQGQLFEAANIAKLWRLPAIMICENNGVGMGTTAERSSASTDYYCRGDYVPGIWVDGMDVLAVREATRFAVEWARSGNGPLVMDVATYRYHGHSMSDPGTSYRTRDEIQKVRQSRDPITGFKDKIITAGLVTDDEIKAIDKKVRAVVEAANQKALSDGLVSPDCLYADIYHNTPPQHIRGATIDHSRMQPAVNSQQLL